MNKINFKKRLVIGTANFTQKYGADPNRIKQSEIKKIINFAQNNKILKIETAESYLDHKHEFKNINKKFKFITKIKPNKRWVSFDFCKKKIDNHFSIFHQNKIETLLFHDIKILFNKEGPKVFENLCILKKKKYFKKIGISIYDINCLDYLISNYNFDVIQCPYNILDKRIVKSGWFNRLKNKGIEVHVRSIFLQGLLVNKLIYKKKYFKKWKSFLSEWFQSLKKKNISPVDYCINDLLTHDFDQIIIGINNCENLKKIIDFKILKKKDKTLNFEIKSLQLIDPRNWK